MPLIADLQLRSQLGKHQLLFLRQHEVALDSALLRSITIYTQQLYTVQQGALHKTRLAVSLKST